MIKQRDVLIVMTRLPREGRNKTRLIPALGPAGATAMHDRLARLAVGTASSYAMVHPRTSLEVHLEGGTPEEGREWLGEVRTAPLIERMVNLRCHLFQTPYGDQGLFLRRQIFHHAGRFPDWPVMEDLHLVRKLKRIGRIRHSAEAAHTSHRRWQQGGTLRTFLRHQLMLAAYHIGVPARHIARLQP